MEVLSIVVPCYNEQESLPLLYERISRVTQEMAASQGNMAFELVLVDDGSEDDTLDVMRSLSVRQLHDPQASLEVRYLSFSRNFGKEAALYAGLSNTRGDYVAIMDADLQDPPELLPKMYHAIVSEDYDCAAAYRSTRSGEPRFRSACARLFYRGVNALADVEIKDGARDFRLMRRRVVDAVLSMSERNRFSKGLFSWAGFKTTWIPYENRERAAGQTSWSFFGLASYGLQGIVSFSTKPLTFASTLGGILCLVAIICIIFVMVRTLLFGDPVAGWPSLACIIMFVGGLQLLFLGILGRYLANAYLETKRRPLYFVRESNVADDYGGYERVLADAGRSGEPNTTAGHERYVRR